MDRLNRAELATDDFSADLAQQQNILGNSEDISEIKGALAEILKIPEKWG